MTTTTTQPTASDFAEWVKDMKARTKKMKKMGSASSGIHGVAWLADHGALLEAMEMTEEEALEALRRGDETIVSPKYGEPSRVSADLVMWSIYNARMQKITTKKGKN